jgi:hypothetical protein
MDIGVTMHALQRWRERAAQYADAGWRELADVFHDDRPVGDDEPLPPGISRRSGFLIRRHEPTATYIVAKAVSADYCLLVTVLSLDDQIDRLVAIAAALEAPGKARKQKWSGVLPPDVGALVGYGPDHPPPPPKQPDSPELLAAKEMAAERRSLRQEYHRLCKLLSAEPTKQLREQVKEFSRRLKEIKIHNRLSRRRKK